MPRSAQQPQPPLRLVLDTNVVVSGLLWNGPPRRLLQAAIDGEVDLFTSAVLLDELAHTLGYTKFTKRVESFGTSIAALAAQYTALVNPVAPASMLRVVANRRAVPGRKTPRTRLHAPVHHPHRDLPDRRQAQLHGNQPACLSTHLKFNRARSDRLGR
jgi:putative PIN family toxin of toxin-antitoxin system